MLESRIEAHIGIESTTVESKFRCSFDRVNENDTGSMNWINNYIYERFNFMINNPK